MAQFGQDVNIEDWISLDDAVEEFGISRRTLYRLIRSEKIPRYKRPGDRKRYVLRADLSRFMGFRELPFKYDP